MDDSQEEQLLRVLGEIVENEPEAAVQLLYSCCTAVVQLLYSCCAAVVQLLYSCTAVVQLYSCSQMLMVR